MQFTEQLRISAVIEDSTCWDLARTDNLSDVSDLLMSDTLECSRVGETCSLRLLLRFQKFASRPETSGKLVSGKTVLSDYFRIRWFQLSNNVQAIFMKKHHIKSWPFHYPKNRINLMEYHFCRFALETVLNHLFFIQELNLNWFLNKKICGILCECNHVGKLATKTALEYLRLENFRAPDGLLAFCF